MSQVKLDFPHSLILIISYIVINFIKRTKYRGVAGGRRSLKMLKSERDNENNINL
jgi:hypothetical protein